MPKENAVRILNLFTIMDRGGAETMVMNYYRHMDRTKIQFDFMVHRNEKGDYDDEIEALGGRIYRFSPIRPWTIATYRRQLKKFFQEHPEYKIIHSHMSELGYYAFVEGEKEGIPIRICHAHNRPFGFDIKTIPRYYLKQRMQSHITHRFVCGIEAGRWLFGKEYEEQFYQLNNAIDTKLFCYNSNKRKKVRCRLGVSDKIVIGHIGRFAPQKNHQFLIKVFEKVVEIQPEVQLVLIGDGEDKKEIEELVKELELTDKVLFLGVRDDIPDLLQAMDVFLFPSLFEGLSVASIEAQTAGLPCVISDKIPIECRKTDLVEQISLDASYEFWAKKTLEVAKTARTDRSEEIRRAGFDVVQNVAKLQEFYLKVEEQGD